jgi:hypothetical protein
LAPKLARILLEGKIVERNIEKAVDILTASTLIKSKYMLMKLSVEEKQYQDAYYYTEFLNNYKCT